MANATAKAVQQQRAERNSESKAENSTTKATNAAYDMPSADPR
jgi:hypothetical protein